MRFGRSLPALYAEVPTDALSARCRQRDGRPTQPCASYWAMSNPTLCRQILSSERQHPVLHVFGACVPKARATSCSSTGVCRIACSVQCRISFAVHRADLRTFRIVARSGEPNRVRCELRVPSCNLSCRTASAADPSIRTLRIVSCRRGDRQEQRLQVAGSFGRGPEHPRRASRGPKSSSCAGRWK